jgi:serine phosphatase RsbU (regulator of sigma subunit)
MRTLTELHDAMRRLSQATTVGALLSIVAEEFREALKPDRIAVGLKREGHHAWPVIVNAQGKPADGTDLPHRLVPKVNALRDSRPFNWKTLGKTRASSWSGGRAAGRRCFIFPIKAGGLSLGHVYAESRRPEWSPLPETIQFLALLTNQAGILLEKLQLLEDQQRMQEVQLEVSRARSVQIQLLPAALVLDPRIDIAARNHPAFTISGDFYDCQSPSPGKVAFIVADVMGHGMSAALMMTRLQAVFQMGVRRGFQLPDVDMRLDEVMQVAGSKVIFASGILGLCDLEKNVLSIASAGHQWPSIFCGEERIEMPDSACAIGWGMPRERQPVQPLTVPLRGRWSLLAHTDGITEAKNAKGAAYSIERLADLHWRHLGLSADEMCDAILDDVLAHTDPSVPVADDMTLFAMCSKK